MQAKGRPEQTIGASSKASREFAGAWLLGTFCTLVNPMILLTVRDGSFGVVGSGGCLITDAKAGWLAHTGRHYMEAVIDNLKARVL